MPQQYSVVQLSFPEPGLFIPRREDLHSNIFSLPLTPPNFSITALSWWGKKHRRSCQLQLPSPSRTQLSCTRYRTSVVWSPLHALLAAGVTLCSSIPHFSCLFWLQALWVWISPHQCSTEGLNWEVSPFNHQQLKCFCSWSDLGSTWQGQCAQHKAVNSAARRTERKCNAGDTAFMFLVHHQPLQKHKMMI